MNENLKRILLYGVLFAVVLMIGLNIYGPNDKNKLLYSDVMTYFKNNEVKSFVVEPNGILSLVLKEDEKKCTYVLQDIETFKADLDANGYLKNVEKYDFDGGTQIPWWVSFLPFALVVVALVALYIHFDKAMKAKPDSVKDTSSSGGFGAFGKMNSFSKARTKLGANEKNKVLFADVAGADEEKEELTEIVQFLKNPKKFSVLGAKIPKGVLLMGEPGTGKTLLAKAVAGEAGVPFFSISGSDFVEMYVGVGASRVRDLFDTAKKSAPSIIFIDEIDAVGRHRGAGFGGGHDEREQTLNQLLVEMDGFGGGECVIVIAATNRPDILDPALLRPGRFDRQIAVNLPDIKGREEILKVHAKSKPFESDVDFRVIAQNTVGFTGADLANVLNEAALLAARREKALIGMNDIEDAIMKVIVGPQKKSKIISEKEKRATAYHEAGHAIVTKLMNPDNLVQAISIIPSGRALGYTVSLPTEDTSNVYKNDLLNKIRTLLGGRAAEEIVLGDISAGAYDDLNKATEIARKMVTQFGMSEVLGPVVLEPGNDEVFLGKSYSNSRHYSENIAKTVDAEIHNIVTKAYNEALDVLRANIDILHFIAGYLVKNETIDSEQFKRAFEADATFEALDEVKTQKIEKSRVDNERRKAENEKAAREAQEKHDNTTADSLGDKKASSSETDDSNVSDDSDDN